MLDQPQHKGPVVLFHLLSIAFHHRTGHRCHDLWGAVRSGFVVPRARDGCGNRRRRCGLREWRRLVQRFVRAIFNYSGEKNNWRTGDQILLSRKKTYGLAHKRIYSAATQKTVGTEESFSYERREAKARWVIERQKAASTWRVFDRPAYGRAMGSFAAHLRCRPDLW